MTLPAPRAAKCPNCGAPIDFKIGASRAMVCEHCQAVVARKGQDFEAIGKVADLIPTGSRIALGAKGHVAKVAFEVVGRLQYEWQAGVWDEWYLALADGRWAWLAEAQGRFYVTFQTPTPPSLSKKAVMAGQSVFIEGLGRMVVADVKSARIVGIAGELPEPVALGDSPVTADLESENGAFATLDYGAPGEAPALYVGRQMPFEALNLGALPPEAAARTPRRAAEKLACPNCGAPITVRVPEQTVRVVCKSCSNLLDPGQGALKVIGAIHRGKHEPRIPLGSRGTLRGAELLVVGWMVRSCRVDGERYPWDEYLLYEEKSQSFKWLVDSDGHWQLATPLSPAQVHVGRDASFRGRRFRHFSNVEGKVEEVLGEFYWEVRTGDLSWLDDYIAPPEGLSREQTQDEVNWTHLEHVDLAELARAFDRPVLTKERQKGVGALQPWPYEAAWRSLSRWMIGGVAALFALLFWFAQKPGQIYLDHPFDAAELLAQAPSPETEGGEPPPADARVHSYLSEPFELTGHEALELQLASGVQQSWAYAGGAVIDEETGESAPFGLEASYYSGVEDGESWSEGSREASQTLSAPGSGRHLLRADLQWDPKRPAPPPIRLRLTSSSYSGWQFLAILLSLLWPLLLSSQRSSFERARWENSNVGSGGRNE